MFMARERDWAPDRVTSSTYFFCLNFRSRILTAHMTMAYIDVFIKRKSCPFRCARDSNLNWLRYDRTWINRKSITFEWKMKSIQFFGAYSLFFFLPWPAGRPGRTQKKTLHISRNHSETFFASGEGKLLCGMGNQVQTTNDRTCWQKNGGNKMCLLPSAVRLFHCTPVQRCGYEKVSPTYRHILHRLYHSQSHHRNDDNEDDAIGNCLQIDKVLICENFVLRFSANIFCTICDSNASELNLSISHRGQCSKSLKIQICILRSPAAHVDTFCAVRVQLTTMSLNKSLEIVWHSIKLQHFSQSVLHPSIHFFSYEFSACKLWFRNFY